MQTKKDELLQYKLERVPFLEEQVRKIREGGKLLTMDIERLLLSEDNRFDFINEVAAEATEYVENNRDEYGGGKKAILHVLSNRVNDMGFYRPEAYAESDPFKPGPGYLKEEFTWPLLRLIDDIKDLFVGELLGFVYLVDRYQFAHMKLQNIIAWTWRWEKYIIMLVYFSEPLASELEAHKAGTWGSIELHP